MAKDMSRFTPPDFERCQANPNVLGWSFMSLGPMPVPVRCPNEAMYLVTAPEEFVDEGSMTLCVECHRLFKQQRRAERYSSELVSYVVRKAANPSKG